MESWVVLGDWLHTEMIYPHTDTTNATLHGQESNLWPDDHKSNTLTITKQPCYSSSWWWTPSRALPYWLLDAKYPFPLPSSKPCGPQSSGAERLRLSLSARWILVDQEVSANQVVVAAQRRWHGGGPPLELIEPSLPEKPQLERLDFFRDWQAARDAPDCVICSVPGVRNP